MKLTKENNLLSSNEKDLSGKDEAWPKLPPVKERLEEFEQTTWVKPNGEGGYGLVHPRLFSHKISHNKSKAKGAKKILKESGKSHPSDKQFSTTEDYQGLEEEEKVEELETQPQICILERCKQPLSIEKIVSDFIEDKPLFYEEKKLASLNESKSDGNQVTKPSVKNAVEQKEKIIGSAQSQPHYPEHKPKNKPKPAYRIFVSTKPQTEYKLKKATQPVTDLDQLSIPELQEKIKELESELSFDSRCKFNGTKLFLANKAKRYMRYRRDYQNKSLSNVKIADICGAISQKFGGLTNNAILYLIFDCFAKKAYKGYKKNPKTKTDKSGQSEQDSEYGLPEIIQSIIQFQGLNLIPYTWKDAQDCLMRAKETILPCSHDEDPELFNLRFEATVLEGLLFFKNK